MFAVYGVAGRLFKGSLEELGRVPGVQGAARSRRIASIGMDGRVEGERPFADVLRESVAHPPVTDVPHRVALAAYGEVNKPSNKRHPLTTVGDIMSREVMTVSDGATIEQAWTQLNAQGVAQAPVVSGQGILVGLLSRAELASSDHLPRAEAHALVWRAFLARNVKDLMWTPIPSVSAGTDIRRLARVLLDTGLPGLPVVEESGAVSGFVSRTDILRAVVADPPLDLWS
jgi:CBS domain-containing protein